MDTGDGAITFDENGIIKTIVIPQNDMMAKTIFDQYYYQLSLFKNRHYAIAKWIVRDIRLAGYVFKQDKQKKNVYYPVLVNPDENRKWKHKMSLVEELHWLHHELDLIKKKIYWNSVDSGESSG
ncbi:hypothetical protein [Namhaeicola litoreus]|uniref:Uncharacterized protein n=1 Tax=Namhaeicola litoreus TaxID=1052145 RepID=A0ABW3XXF6_9FLAO